MGRSLLYGVIRVFRALPLPLALWAGALSGRLLRLFSRRKVDRAEANAVRALGVGVTLARRIVRDSYANFGRSAAEFVKMREGEDFTRRVRLRNPEYLRRALEMGRGAILMSGHFGNWELCAAGLIQHGFPLNAVYTPQRNGAGVEDFILNQRERVAGMKMIESEGASLKRVFKVLREGGILIVFQDLDARRDGLTLPFMGMKARVHTGIARLARRFGCPVIPTCCVRRGTGGAHEILFSQPVQEALDKKEKPFGEDLEKSLEICNNIIAQWVSAYPEQWLWMLDRWEFASKCG
jgi:KDO2-lipid IV(A) lauroyltransferase